MRAGTDARAAEAIAGAIRVDEGAVRSHVAQVVRGTLEETLNALLDAEADAICGAGRYERSAGRRDTRAGSYERRLQTQAGEVTLKVPRLRNLPFETAIIERYRRLETSVEEALMEMYQAGVSVRRVEDITEALWETRVSPSTVSDLNKKLYERIGQWLARPVEGEHPYLFLDGVWLKRSRGGEVRNVAVLIAVAVNEHGYREILAVREGMKEDAESWRGLLRDLKARGLAGVRLVVSDKALGLVEALGEFFPDAAWQRCAVHFYRNVFSAVPREKGRETARMLKAIHAGEDREAALKKIAEVAEKLEATKLSKVARIVREGAHETLSYYAFPSWHWRSIRTKNMLERLIREVRRRTRAVGAFPDGESAVMPVAARLRHLATTAWGERCYLSPERFEKEDAA